jgi:hypothetical protein
MLYKWFWSSTTQFCFGVYYFAKGFGNSLNDARKETRDFYVALARLEREHGREFCRGSML